MRTVLSRGGRSASTGSGLPPKRKPSLLSEETPSWFDPRRRLGVTRARKGCGRWKEHLLVCVEPQCENTFGHEAVARLGCPVDDHEQGADMTLTPAREVRTASIIGARGHRTRPRKLVIRILGVALGVIMVLGACGDRASSTGEEVGAGPSSTQSPTPSVVPPAPSTTQPVAPMETTPPSTRSPVNTSISPLPPKPTGPFVYFTMPSGNIGCMMQSDGLVRCDIRQRDWAPPAKPADCKTDFGHAVLLGKGAGFVCAGDTVLIGAPVLPYGSTSRQGKYECRSDEVGVTCTNLESGHGFLLSAAEYRLF